MKKDILQILNNNMQNLDSATRYSDMHFLSIKYILIKGFENLKGIVRKEHLSLIEKTITLVEKESEILSNKTYKDSYKRISNTVGATISFFEKLA